jgi:hypothetical protein
MRALPLFPIVNVCMMYVSTIYLSIYASAVAPRNASSLHAARELLHRGVKQTSVRYCNHLPI